MWVNNDLVMLSYPRTKAYVDRTPTLFGADKELDDVLEKISINGENWLDCFLAAGGMSAAWRAHGKMPEIFVEKEGMMFLLMFSLSVTPSPLLLGKSR